jgi:hypothetical protein
VLVQQLLDLGNRHLLAAAVDHILDPAGDPQIAVSVDRRQVARAVPAVGGQRRRGLGRAVEVSGEQGVGPDLEVALGAGR